MKKTEHSSSVRVDFLGGTLDIDPINHILKNVVTINCATSLKANVIVEETKSDKIIIKSLDYNNSLEYLYSDLELKDESFFGPFLFVARLISFFNVKGNLKLTLRSGSPPGAGLGGSSALGVCVFKALSDFFNRPFINHEIFKIVKNIEASVLDAGPTGYQDYLPAIHGGILAIHSTVEGEKCEQLFNDKLKTFLEENLMLVSSEISRNSGINNWEVIKGFFDKEERIREGLSKLNELSRQAYQKLKGNLYDEFLECLIEEGNLRKKLFQGIECSEVSKLKEELLESHLIKGLKVCGAGGGGCFLLILNQSQKENVAKVIEKNKMKILEFKIGGVVEF